MIEYSPEWYEKAIKKSKILTCFFAAAAIILIVISPFFLAKMYPTIGINEDNAEHIETQIKEMRKRTDENGKHPYYEFDTEDDKTYYIDWKCYKDVYPYITVNGYEGHKFSFMIDRENYVIQMEVEGREEPLITFDVGYDRINSQHLLDACPGIIALALSVYFILISAQESKLYKKYIKELEKGSLNE